MPTLSARPFRTLILGAGTGANAANIGSAANILAAGWLAQAGYRVGLGRFVRDGALVTAATLALVTIWLLIRYRAWRITMRCDNRSAIPSIPKGLEEMLMLLIVFVLDDCALLTDILEGWTAAGVRGITIIESTGVHRIRSRVDTHDAPLMLGLSRLLRTDQVCQNTLFALVEEVAIVERVKEATEAVVGDLSGPNTGVLFTVPVAAAWGLPKQPLAPG